MVDQEIMPVRIFHRGQQRLNLENVVDFVASKLTIPREELFLYQRHDAKALSPLTVVKKFPCSGEEQVLVLGGVEWRDYEFRIEGRSVTRRLRTGLTSVSPVVNLYNREWRFRIALFTSWTIDIFFRKIPYLPASKKVI
jgi:hypothetical protein